MGLGAHAITHMNIRRRQASTQSSPSNTHPNLQRRYMLVGGNAVQGDDLRITTDDNHIIGAVAPYCVPTGWLCGVQLGGHSSVVKPTPTCHAAPLQDAKTKADNAWYPKLPCEDLTQHRFRLGSGSTARPARRGSAGRRSIRPSIQLPLRWTPMALAVTITPLLRRRLRFFFSSS